MSKFRAPSKGGNVVHRVEFPELALRRSRRLIAKRRGQSPVDAAGAGLDPKALEAAARAALARQAAEAKALEAYTLPSKAPAEELLEERELVPRPSSLEDSQARRQIELLERRLAKMARLMERRDSELLSGAARPAVDDGVASIYRDVQGIEGVTEEGRQKKALMSRIFEANLKLRERVTSPSSSAE